MGATQKPRFLQGFLNFRNMNFINGQPTLKATLMGLTIFLGVPVAGLCWFSSNEDFYAENREIYAKKRINFTANTNPSPIYKADGVREFDVATFNANIFIPQDAVFGENTPLHTFNAAQRLSHVHATAQANGDSRPFYSHGYVNAKYVPIDQAEYNAIGGQSRKNLRAVYNEHKGAIVKA